MRHAFRRAFSLPGVLAWRHAVVRATFPAVSVRFHHQSPPAGSVPSGALKKGPTPSVTTVVKATTREGESEACLARFQQLAREPHLGDRIGALANDGSDHKTGSVADCVRYIHYSAIPLVRSSKDEWELLKRDMRANLRRAGKEHLFDQILKLKPQLKPLSGFVKSLNRNAKTNSVMTAKVVCLDFVRDAFNERFITTPKVIPFRELYPGISKAGNEIGGVSWGVRVGEDGCRADVLPHW